MKFFLATKCLKNQQRGEKMNWFRIVLGMVILIIVGLISLIYWHKRIDCQTTWVYAVYIIIILILSLFVLIGLEQYWLVH